MPATVGSSLFVLFTISDKQAEYGLRQAAIKAEPLEIIYSYYNGTGHRRAVTVRKGDSVGQFLKAVVEQLTPQFREIRCTWRPGCALGYCCHVGSLACC